MPKIERKYLAHFIDVNFGVGSPRYVRLGKDLEEYSEELNPDVEVNKNILGEQNVQHNGYEVQSEVDPYYAYSGDALFEQLAKIANGRLTGDDCMTTKVDVLLSSGGAVLWAYREDCWVVPNSVGGDTSGVQIPFTVYNASNRVAGTWNTGNNTFSAQGGGNVTLTGLTVVGTDNGAVTLSPAVFDGDFTTYTAEVTDESSVTITPTATGSPSYEYAVNGQPCQSLVSLVEGANVITIKVTNGTASQTYTVIVYADFT